MAKQLAEWTAAQHTAGQKAAGVWRKFFQAESKTAIEKAEEIVESAKIVEVQDKYDTELLKLDNVVGVAPSLKVTGGKPTKTWSLTVLVEKKEPKTKLSKASLVPEQSA